MEDDERALLRACAASPADDTERLVYADWLTEHGEAARAEFIRCSVRASDPAVDAAERSRNQARARELATAHHAEWERGLVVLGVGPPPGLTDPLPWVVYDRGLPVQIAIPVAAFVANGEAIRALAPTVTRLDFSSRRVDDADIERLTACPHLAGIRRLDLRNNRLRDAALTSLADCAHLAGLEHLDLQLNEFGARGMIALKRSPNFSPELTLILFGTDTTRFDHFQDGRIDRPPWGRPAR